MKLVRKIKQSADFGTSTHNVLFELLECGLVITK